MFELSPIKAIELAATRVPGAVSLAQGIPSLEPPEEMREAVVEKIRQGRCDRYSLTTGLLELREELSTDLAKDGLLADPESEIIVTAGSIEGISATLLALTNPGDEVIIPSPTYASYIGSIQMARCTPRFVELDEDNQFDFYIEKLRSAITKKTRIILYANPNNPTGTIYSKDKTDKLVELALQHNIIIVTDDVYKDFYYVPHKHVTPASYPEARKNVVRVCSFSKAFAVTGWRVGFLHGDKSLVSKILKYHDAMVTCAPVVSQYAAIALLSCADEYLKRMRTEFKSRRDYALECLNELDHVLDYQTPLATYFVFPRIKDTAPLAHDSNKLAYDMLEKAKVAVVPGIAFGPTGESHFRITYGRDWDALREGMSRIAEYMTDRTSTRSKVSKTNGKPIPREMGKSFLASSARLYLKKLSPTVIGIVGTKGKTTLKRSICRMLSKHFHVRSSILSYNTTTGLPLSVLGIRSPRSLKGLLSLPLKILWKLISRSEKVDYLVLEYGISSEEDAKKLLNIAKPEWLVVGGISHPDPGVSCQKVRNGVKVLVDSLPSEKVLWCETDPLVKSLSNSLKNELAIDKQKLSEDTLKTLKRSYPINWQPIGSSAQESVVASVLIAEQLGVPEAEIEGFLAKEYREEVLKSNK